MNNENNNGPNDNNDYDDSSKAAIRIILLLSLILLSVDLFSLYSTLETIIKYSNTYPLNVFENCFKYQSIAEVFFSAFGSFAAVSACLLSLSLMVEYEYFYSKLLETFVKYNYCVFGPYLLASCFLGGYYFDRIAYVCDEHLSEKKHLNMTMVLSLLFSFIVSAALTIIYAMLVCTSLLHNSIRFRREGNVFIGKLFWFFIGNRVTRSFNIESNDNPQIEREDDAIPLRNID